MQNDFKHFQSKFSFYWTPNGLDNTIRRGSASRRVDAPNHLTNPPNLPNLKQAHKGEGLPSLYPLPNASSRRAFCFLGMLLAALTLQKVIVKPMKNQHLRFSAPPGPHICPLHLLIKVFHRNSIEFRLNLDRISIKLEQVCDRNSIENP